MVVLGYASPADREIAALFCSAMALGRASSIVSACRRALEPFGQTLAASLPALGFDGIRARLAGFKHRFFGAEDAASLLRASSILARRHGSLEAAFLAGAAAGSDRGATPGGYSAAGPSAALLARCDSFVDQLRAECPWPPARNLLPAPRDGSACKRLMLFLRWMVRSDCVDPGGWTRVSPAELVLPLDTHLHRISRALGLTERRTADLRAALETTAALRSIDPADPIRFDFSLARLGIRSDYSLNSFLRP